MNELLLALSGVIGGILLAAFVVVIGTITSGAHRTTYKP